MKFEVSLISASLILVGIGIIQFLLAQWTRSRIEHSIKSKYEKILEEYRYNLKVKERAERIAEYLSLYYEDSQNFQKLNQLSWELSLWLPSNIYINLGTALNNVGPGMDLSKTTVLDILIDTRQLLLEDSGNLTADNIIVHGKDIGRK